MKIISLLLCTALILLTFSACNYDLNFTVDEEKTNSTASYEHIDDIIPQTTQPDEETGDPYFSTLTVRPIQPSQFYDPVSLTYGYDSLQEKHLQDCYNKLVSAMYSISDTTDKKGRYMIPKIRIRDHKVTQTEITVVMQAIAIDYPEVFWLHNIFSYVYENGGTLIQLYSVTDFDTVQRNINILSGTVSNIISEVPGGLSEYDREKYVHNFMIDNCSYNESIKSISDGWEAFTSYGSIALGRAICGGYASGMQYLLNTLGISCITVTGRGLNELHMWNLVRIDGLWYHLDTTWSDNEDSTRYDYFNLDDSMMLNDHTLSPLYDTNTGIFNNDINTYNVFVERCKSREANYYYKECGILYEFSPENETELISRIANTAVSGKEYFSFVIGSELDYENTINSLFYESPYKFFYYIEEANKLSEVKLDTTKLSVIKKEFLNVITVKLELQ